MHDSHGKICPKYPSSVGEYCYNMHNAVSERTVWLCNKDVGFSGKKCLCYFKNLSKIKEIKVLLMEKSTSIIPKLLLQLSLVMQRNLQLVIHATGSFDIALKDTIPSHPFYNITATQLWLIIFPFTI